MDRSEALAVADGVLSELRKLSYGEWLQRLNRPSVKSVESQGGRTYEVEVEAFWDGAKNGNIRVVALVSGGGWSDFAPLSRDFIIAPDGSFIGENTSY